MVLSKSGPLAVILGATGAQGGSVIKHLLASDQPYRLRAITRDPSKPSGKTLSEQGVDVIKADITSEQDLTKAFDGAEIVFGVTNFWESGDPKKEEKDGKLIVDAAKEAKVKLFVWSGLEPVAKVSKGKYTAVTHFDSKAAVSDYARSSGVPTAVVQPGFYLSNFATMMVPRKQPDGSFALSFPIKGSTKVPVIDIKRDYGAFVRAAIESKELGAGSEVLAAAEYISFDNVMAKWSKLVGVKGTFNQIPKDVFLKFVPKGGEELAEMLEYFQDYGYFAGKDIEPSKKQLASPARTWEEFAKATDWSKVIA